MAVTCVSKIVESLPSRETHIDSLEEDVKSVAELHRFILNSNGDIMRSALDTDGALTTVDAIIKDVSGFDTYEAFRNNADLSMKRHVSNSLKAYVEAAVRAGVDHSRVMTEFSISDNVANMVKIAAASDENIRKTHEVSSASGVFRHLTGDVHELVSDRYRVISQHAPSRKFYAMHGEIENYMKNRRGALIDAVDKLVKDYETAGIKGEDLRHLMTYLDGRYIKTYDSTVEPGTDRRIVTHDTLREAMRGTSSYRRHERAYQKRFPQAEQREIEDVFIDKLKEAQRQWNTINYGVANPTEGEYRPEDHPDSVVGFIYESGNMLKQMIEERQKYTSYADLDRAERAYYDKFNEQSLDFFKPRLDNYVPSKAILEEDMFKSFKNMDDADGLPGLKSFLMHSNNKVEASLDFVATMQQNLLSYQYAVEQISKYSMLHGMKAALDQTPDSWKESNPTSTNAIRYFADTLLDDLEAPTRKKSALVEAARNFSIAATSIGAMMLAAPNSAISNYMGGYLGFMNRYGSDFFSMQKNYEAALKDKTNQMALRTATKVNQYVSDYMLSPARQSEYQQLTAGEMTPEQSSNLIVKASKTARDWAMRASDFSTSRGVLFFLPHIEALTMKGSETHLWEQAGAILYDKVYGDIQARERAGQQITDSMIAESIARHKEDAFYGIRESVGDFSQLNKPFWSWMTLKHADTLPKVIAGGAMNMFWMFRQVSVHNMNMLMKAGTELFSPDSGWTLKQRALGATPLAGLFASIALLVYDWWAKEDEDVWRMSSLLTVNPLQEATTLARGAWRLGLAPALNLSVPEWQAEEAASDLMRLAGGVLAGQTLEKTAEDIVGGSFGMQSIATAIGKSKDITNLRYAFPRYLSLKGRDEYYDIKSQIREDMDNPAGMMLYSNDYVNISRKLFPVLFAHSDDPDENAKIRATRLTDAKNLALSLFGLSPYKHPQAYEGVYGRHATIKSDYRRMRSYRYYHNGTAHRGAIDRMVDQIGRYGRIYPSSYTDIPGM